jgi:C4-dicarboxylate-specific signal transduction histidine kinase
MRFLRNVPIKRKLTFITMLSSCVALLLACVAFVTYEQITFRQTMARELLILADMFDDNVAPGLAFNDAASMTQTLKTLSADPHILAAAVYDKQGKVVAQYRRNDLRKEFRVPPVEPAGYQFREDRLDTFQPIKLAGEEIGSVYITSDLEEMRARFWRYAAIVGLVLLVSSLVAFAVSSKLRKVISEPIWELSSVANVVATEKNYSVRAVKKSEDELGHLIDRFNEMLSQIQERDSALQERTRELQSEIQERKDAEAKLESTHGQLLEASRYAGMAEVATGVLHNVGNVLNSVNVSASLAQDLLRQPTVDHLTGTAALLRQHTGDMGAFLSADPKGKIIPGFVIKLADQLSAEHLELIKELTTLSKNVEHIKEIVAMQQTYARVSGLIELLAPAPLLEDALRINESGLLRHGARVEREFDDVPPVAMDKHKVLQILINLIGNAKYAVAGATVADKRVTLRIRQLTPERVQIQVADNGVGIPPENLTRIFSVGFTTKKDGHGFGLHSGANAAKEMGGQLTAHSDGPGCGATFTLELPVAFTRQDNVCNSLTQKKTTAS